MRKEIPLILTGALFLYGCATDAQAKSADPAAPTLEPTKSLPQLGVDTTTLDKIVLPTPYAISTEIPVDNSCIMPFERAKWDTGLRFMDVITNRGKPDRTENGGLKHHLGTDFAGIRGTDIVSVCDGILVFAGPVREGNDLKNLGNIVVIKYDDDYAVYAHMENIIGNDPGEIIKKGTKIGELGSSGGWEKSHLHFQIWKGIAKTEVFDQIAKNDYAENNPGMVYGYYPEDWDEGEIHKYLEDPKAWLQARLGQ